MASQPKPADTLLSAPLIRILAASSALPNMIWDGQNHSNDT